MLKLNDGRNELWQWDTGRILSVDAECSQVHFARNVYGRSIDVDVIDGVAKVPDFLLQIDKPITAWAFVGTPENGYTKISKEFVVNKRNKPSDYVFTPTEQVALKDVIARLEDVEENQSAEAIGKIVDDYLAENQVTSPVQSVNGKKGNVVLTAEDVGALPESTKIPAEYKLPVASSETLGGVKAEPVTDGDTQPVRIGVDGVLYTAPGSGEKWETIIDYTVPEDCVQVLLTTDINGNTFKLKEAIATFILHPLSDGSSPGSIRFTCDGTVSNVYVAEHFAYGSANAPTAAGTVRYERFDVVATPNGVWMREHIATTQDINYVENGFAGARQTSIHENINPTTLKSKVTEVSAIGVGSYMLAVGKGTRIVLMGVRA